MLKSWCACLQDAITCEHGRWIFLNFPQSHHLSSNLTTNFLARRTSLGFTISFTLNLVVFLSNSFTWCVFDLESEFCRKLVAYLEYTWLALTIAIFCLPLFMKYMLHMVYVANTMEEIGKFLVFFKTNLLLQPDLLLCDPTFFLVICKTPLFPWNLVYPSCCFWVVFSNDVVVLVAVWCTLQM